MANEITLTVVGKESDWRALDAPGPVTKLELKVLGEPAVAVWLDASELRELSKRLIKAAECGEVKKGD